MRDIKWVVEEADRLLDLSVQAEMDFDEFMEDLSAKERMVVFANWDRKQMLAKEEEMKDGR